MAIGIFAENGPPPPDADLKHTWVATEPCTIPIDDERTINLVVGQCVAFNDASFEESPRMHEAVMALVSSGVLWPHGQQMLN